MDIAHYIATGRNHIAALEAYKAAEYQMEQARREAEIAESWAPVMDVIRQELPLELHPYLKRPEVAKGRNRHETVAPVILDIPDLHPIGIYVFGREFEVWYLVERLFVDLDCESGVSSGQPCHMHSSAVANEGTRDLYIAIARAADERGRWPEVQSEAQRLRAEGEARRASAARSTLDSAKFYVQTVDEPSAAIAYALIAIAECLGAPSVKTNQAGAAVIDKASRVARGILSV